MFQIQAGPFGAVPLLDEASYLAWAERIVGGELLGEGLFAQDPLYPYLLALLRALGGGMLAARVVNAALALGALALLFSLARRLLGNRAALFAAGCFVFWGSLLLDEAGVGKETLALFLTLLALEGAARALASGRLSQWGWAGLAVGALALTRGNFLVLCPLFALLVALVRPRAALAFGAGVAAVLLLLSARNGLAAGDWSPLAASSGMNLYIGNHPGADGSYRREAFLKRPPVFETADFQEEASRRLSRPLGPREASSYWTGEVLRFWREQPGEALALFWRKVRLLFAARELPNNTSLFCMRELFLPVLSTAPLGFGWLWPLALAGAVAWLRERRAGRWVWLASAAYAGTLVLTFVLERYRVPLAPAAALGAGFFLDRLWELAQAKAWRPAAVLCAPLALSAPLVWLPVGEFLSPRQELAQCTSLVGSALADAGSTDEALHWLARSVELDPRDPGALYNLGVALQRAGRGGDAEAAYREALALAPGHGQARFNLALLLLARGAGAEALAELDAASRGGLPLERLLGPRGAALALTGALAAAEEALRGATAATPKDAAAWAELARVQARRGRCEELTATLEAAARAGAQLERPACPP